MGFACGIFTSDPNLLPCELLRLSPDIPLVGDEPDESMGAGWFADGDVLVRRYPASEARPSTLSALGPLESEALLLHGGRLPVGMSLEDNEQPFRLRHWLFVHKGAVTAPERFRARVLESLPEPVARQVSGTTLSELAFAGFLTKLREARPVERGLEARAIVEALGRTARWLAGLSMDSQAASPSMSLLATNGRVFGAVRVGDGPLHVRLLEGSASCDRCKLDGSAAREPLLRAHLRRRTVVVATHVRDARSWMELSDGEALAVGPKLDVERLRI